MTGPTKAADALLALLKRWEPDLDWSEVEDDVHDAMWANFDEGRKSGAIYPNDGMSAPERTEACGECGGDGFQFRYGPTGNAVTNGKCPRCGGSGRKAT